MGQSDLVMLFSRCYNRGHCNHAERFIMIGIFILSSLMPKNKLLFLEVEQIINNIDTNKLARLDIVKKISE